MSERPPGLSSGYAVRCFVGDASLSNSPAGRLDQVAFLLAPPMYDDDGHYLGIGEPLITNEEARRLLNDLVPTIEATTGDVEIETSTSEKSHSSEGEPS